MREAVTRFHFLDRDEIHTVGSFYESMLHAVPSDREKKTMFFGSGERFNSTSVRIAGPVFDLKKDGDAILFPDNIDLSSFGCDKIGGDDFVVVFLKILYGKELGLIACSSG